MSRIKIDKGIPLPKTQSRGRFAGVPEMEVGDSIFVPGVSASASGHASQFSRQYKPKKFKSYRWSEDGVDGYRIWRVK